MLYRLNPGDTTGFLALDRTNKLIVLSFRGTRTPGNIITDLEYQQVPIDEIICPNCQVHRGFYYAWGNFSQFIMPSIDHVAAEYPDYSIVFTGHSLGGALATFGAVLEGSANRPIGLVSTTAKSRYENLSGQSANETLVYFWMSSTGEL